MDGSVEIEPNGSPVVEQLWVAVGELMSYTSRLIKPLFNTVGVTSEEQSPLCLILLSPTNLRDEFIEYLPRTFSFGDDSGTAEPSKKMRLLMLLPPRLKQLLLNYLGCLQTKF